MNYLNRRGLLTLFTLALTTLGYGSSTGVLPTAWRGLPLPASLRAGTAPRSTPAGVQREVASQSVRTTAEVRGDADAQLHAIIVDFEKRGGRGGWLSSMSPFGDSVAPQYYYLIQQLPEKAAPKSGIFVLRTQQGLDYFNELLKVSKVPVLLGTILQQTQVEAAALGGYALSQDVFAAFRLSGVSSLVLLKPTASKMVIAHEYRHWRDFEDPKFEAAVMKSLKEFFDATYLTNDEKQTLYQIVLEIRGHATMSLQAKDDLEKKRDFVDRAGNINVGGTVDTQESLEFQVREGAMIFSQAYSSAFFSILAKVEKKGASAKTRFIKKLSEFDLSTEFPGHRVTFKAVFGL